VTPAWYGYDLGEHGWDDRLAVDGRLALHDASGETYVGFFSSDVQGFRPANFVGLRLEGEGGYSNVEVSYTTGRFESGGADAPFTMTPDGDSRRFVLEYLPDGGNGNGSIAITIEDQVHVYDLPDGPRDSPMRIDRFGIMNVQKPGGGRMELYLDDLGPLRPLRCDSGSTRWAEPRALLRRPRLHDAAAAVIAERDAQSSMRM
jgi:hypothetical protein